MPPPWRKRGAREPAAKQTTYDDDDYGAFSDASNSDTDSFETRDKLPHAVVKKWAVKDLVRLLDTPYLDLDAEYQRDVVWKQNNMTGLINSLMEDYYIPPLIFNVQIVVDEQGQERFKRVCVDGKQRLSSVHAFVKGKIPVLDRKSRRWFFAEASDEDGQIVRRAGGRILPASRRRDFLDKTLICTEYRDLGADQEEELFARVQKGIALTPAERLRATTGPWQTLAKFFVEKHPRIWKLPTVYDKAVAFGHALKVMAQVIECRTPSGANGSPRQVYGAVAIRRFCENEQHLCREEAKLHLTVVLETFDRLVERSPTTFANNNYGRAKAFAPSELIAVAVLISQYREARSDDMLLGDIAHMRSSLRAALPDIRLDTTTWKSAWMYIEQLESWQSPSNGAESRFQGIGSRTHAVLAASNDQALSHDGYGSTALLQQTRKSGSSSVHSNPAKSRATSASSHTSTQVSPVLPLSADAETPFHADLVDRQKSAYPPHPSPRSIFVSQKEEHADDLTRVQPLGPIKRQASDSEDDVQRRVREALARRRKRMQQ